MLSVLTDFGFIQDQLGLSHLVGGGVVLLVIWRLWRFTVRPLLNPDSPREVPYLIPSHAVPMLRSPHALLSSAIKDCKGSGEPIAINVFGQKIYFVLSEQDATAVLREPPQLTHTEHLKNLLMGLGCSESGISEMDHDSEPKAPPLVLVAEELMRKQLLEKSLSPEILARSLEVLESHMRWDRLEAPTLLHSSEDGRERTVSLYRWAQTAIIHAVTTAYFGNAIWELSPYIVEDLVCLESDLWILLFKLPRPCGKEVRVARARVLRCLVDYMRLPPSSQQEQSWAVRNSIMEMRRRGLSEDDMASYLLMVLSNANVFKLPFWLLAHICTNQTRLQRVTTEVATLFAQSTAANEPLAALALRLEQNPLLSALYNETQRLTMNSSSARSVEKPLTVNGRTFQAGAHLLVPYRQLAMSHPVLGRDWDRFLPERFLDHPGLAQSKSFLPFGAGKHKCVGRYLSKRLSLTFVALVVHRFHVVRALDGVPAVGFTPVSSGPGGPVKGGDVRVVIAPKEDGLLHEEK
ncbi:cytochrome P450 [Aspergillus brunneoviolaceus CBS 621.78]|uniref:Cytochrome P450 n=1 Tax=Aspergillus brunneoviolaceus CBS 621.78 TaxID=1450534 RepID=A0ACD1G682_9EURO|nr:cytochrome P450 [Aspergillus brunneoviolaceus CBS 621.78]RAH44659.1 cytochrome P450 [Aspergillus brunneoviolaceus CBS 621.78]